MREKKILFRIMCSVIIIINSLSISVKGVTVTEKNTDLAILVDLQEERLYLIDKGKNNILKSYTIASGKSDSPSPIGTWTVIYMSKSTGSFGTRWVRLNVPWGQYGIHGTNRPDSIGFKASHGCIRMFNEDIEELYKYVRKGMTVVICTCPYGAFEKGFITLKPGDRGSEVYEVQKEMKKRGYYPKNLTGIYGEVMQKYVLKFRRDNKLTITDVVDMEFYNKLGITIME